MKKLLLFLSLIVFVSVVRADIPRPDKTKKLGADHEVSTRLYISVRSEEKEPVLEISRSTFRELRAALDEAEADQNFAENVENESGISRSQTLVSGLFFSFAFIIGGVWMFRSRTRNSKIAMSLLILAALGVGTTVIFANSAPPAVISLTSHIFDKKTKGYGYATGNIKVRVSSKNDDRIYLKIPRAVDDPDLK